MMYTWFMELPEPDPLLSVYDVYCNAQGDSNLRGYTVFFVSTEKSYETHSAGLNARVHQAGDSIKVTIFSGEHEL